MLAIRILRDERRCDEGGTLITSSVVGMSSLSEVRQSVVVGGVCVGDVGIIFSGWGRVADKRRLVQFLLSHLRSSAS